MKTFPMFLKVTRRRIVIIGGGEQAAQKARLVLKTEAELILVAPELDPELQDFVASGRMQHQTDQTPELFKRTVLVFVATGCKGADAAWHNLAKAAGVLVNVVDYPELCDAITPSIVDRDPVVVAIGTEGTAPVLGRQIKTRIEKILHPRLGAYASLAGRLRVQVARYVPSADRRSFWRWVFNGTPWVKFSVGNEREAAEIIKTSITDLEFSQTAGRLSIVSGASTPDLVTLRIVERLQSADVIYASDEVSADVLELARRDARRVQINTTHHRLTSGTVNLAMKDAAEPANVVCLFADHEQREIPEASGVEIEHLNCAVSRSSRVKLAKTTMAVSTTTT